MQVASQSDNVLQSFTGWAASMLGWPCRDAGRNEATLAAMGTQALQVETVASRNRSPHFGRSGGAVGGRRSGRKEAKMPTCAVAQDRPEGVNIVHSAPQCPKWFIFERYGKTKAKS